MATTLTLDGTPLSFFTVPGTHTLYDDALRHSADGLGVYTTGFTQLVDNGICSGNCSVEIEIDWDTTGSPSGTSEMGMCFINSARDGFSVIAQSGLTRLRKEVGGSAGSTIASATPTYTGIITLKCFFSTVTGDIDLHLGGVSILTGNYIDNLTGLRCGLQQYNGGASTSINRTMTTDIGGAASKPVKYWDGSAWTTKPLKYWNGSSWVTKPLKYWNGSAWV